MMPIEDYIETKTEEKRWYIVFIYYNALLLSVRFFIHVMLFFTLDLVNIVYCEVLLNLNFVLQTDH